MNVCLHHNQWYDPRAGGFCPYCGVPVVSSVGGYPFMSTTIPWEPCANCGQYKPRSGPHTCVVALTATPGQP